MADVASADNIKFWFADQVIVSSAEKVDAPMSNPSQPGKQGSEGLLSYPRALLLKERKRN